MTKLTPDILYKMGFGGEGKSRHLNRPLYRKKIEGYPFELQMELGDYPPENGNSGILSLYMPPVRDMHLYTSQDIGEGKIDYIDWTDAEAGVEGGIKYITDHGMNQPIAWSVTTVDRLAALIRAITNKPFVFNESEKEPV